MNFEACLTLPRDPREAVLIAETLESLAGALRTWPTEAWRKLASNNEPTDGLFGRLAQRTAQSDLTPEQRKRAAESADAVAGVLRVLWPQPQPAAEARESEELVSIG
jgi:hypothetical protein